MNETAAKRGYLTGAFHIFHLKDTALSPIPFHYHDFHKILLFLGTAASYIIEGKTWHLAPRDIVFVRAGEIHRPLPTSGAPYERIVIYVSPKFLARWKKGSDDLAACFFDAPPASNVMHLPPGKTSDLLLHMEKLARTSRADGFANDLYTEILFIEFMILLNRAYLHHDLDLSEAAAADEKIIKLLTYINEHLIEPLSIDRLAAAAYMSRSHLMHSFKAATGYTLRQYIISKRLLLAKKYLQESPARPITEIARLCGFEEYLPFFRAFKGQFHITPQEWREQYRQGADPLLSMNENLFDKTHFICNNSNHK